jgi:nitroimidazol reductase NimA-like FMN-containing flavoprotein (pyridoxamine 5'-phosphate oxidase superfamily)
VGGIRVLASLGGRETLESVESRGPRNDLEILEREECLRLLADHHFGRIAFLGASWPVILPVNYLFDEPSLLIRTGPGDKLDFAPLAGVAFEIDAADPAGAWGWSVLAQGPAFDITESTDAYSERLRSLAVAPWAPGRRDHWLKLSVVSVSGRRFGSPSE